MKPRKWKEIRKLRAKFAGCRCEASQRRMMEAVPSADVIVTNPTHFAVALKYDLNSSGAPILVAKGTDLVAAQIRNLAMAAQHYFCCRAGIGQGFVLFDRSKPGNTARTCF